MTRLMTWAIAVAARNSWTRRWPSGWRDSTQRSCTTTPGALMPRPNGTLAVFFLGMA
jgi:hypothetical protein